MNQTKNQVKQFPLVSKTVEFPYLQENIRADQIMISNNRKYISFITHIQDEKNNCKLKNVKLYNLVTQKLIKELTNFQGLNGCQFSQDSKILIVPGIKYYILYHIELDKTSEIQSLQELKFSNDATKFLCESKNTLQISDQNFIFRNVNQYLMWQFSSQNHYLISFKKRYNNWSSLQYLRTKNNKLHITLDIKIPITLRNLELKFFEWFLSRQILLFSDKFIKIYNFQGKLVRNIPLACMNAKCESINVYNDKHGKPVLVSVFSPHSSLQCAYKCKGFVCILPVVKICLHKIIAEYIICFNVDGLVSFSTSDLSGKNAQISYLD